MIVSDTFRRDHLGCYGNKGIYTPNLDKFAHRCAQFENCYAASFPTMPNRADLFTGKFTFSYLGWMPLPAEEKVLAEILFEEADYTTIAVVDTPFFVRRGFNCDRGFKDFVWVPGQGSERTRINSERQYEEDYCAPRTISMAEKCLEYYHKEKFFLYVDIWDPHEPWDPLPERVKLYYPSYAGQLIDPCYWDWHEYGLKEEDINIAHACYCGEITMVDFWIGRLLNKIESLGILEDTIIVFTSDHGFYFGNHGYFGKGRRKDPRSQEQRERLYFSERKGETGYWYRSPLYEEIVRVPLLIYIPGVRPRRVKSLVSSVDLMPTFLQLVGVEIPKNVHGKSLVPLLEGEKETLRDFVVTSWGFSEIGKKTKAVDGQERKIKEIQPCTITTEKWGFLYTTEDYPTELYDLERDPYQSENVSCKNPKIVRDLHHQFVEFLEQIGTDERYLSPRRKVKTSLINGGNSNF